jgi:hypothetical protein
VRSKIAPILLIWKHLPVSTAEKSFYNAREMFCISDTELRWNSLCRLIGRQGFLNAPEQGFASEFCLEWVHSTPLHHRLTYLSRTDAQEQRNGDIKFQLKSWAPKTRILATPGATQLRMPNPKSSDLYFVPD